MRQTQHRAAISAPPLEPDGIKTETHKRNHVWPRKLEIAIKSMGVVAFFLSCVALWPTMASASDTKLATSLAKWTSMKDFIEFCELHRFNTSDCILVRNMTLSPPPGFANLNARRWILEADIILAGQLEELERGSSILALIKFLYPILGFLTILSYVKRRYPHYQLEVSRHLASFSKSLKVRREETTADTTEGQITVARFGRTGVNGGGSRRRRILRSRHHHAASSKRGSNITEDMDDSSSDELLYARQTGFSGETRRISRLRLRRRTGGPLRE
ncbi:hypothetical protein V8F20_006689 [Naviculisporaceae sp. PSN 640]